GTGTLNGGYAVGSTSFNVNASFSKLQYGYVQIGPTGAGLTLKPVEVVRYATLTTDGLSYTNTLKGQGGTIDTAWVNGDPVSEANIMFKCFRLPVPLTSPASVVEIPQPLWPLIELYVLAKVRASEQDDDSAMKMSQSFDQS